ncbi:O-Antigen ligase [Bradyrhizobium sp. Rc2d]|nr:O-Antigen ligase [Bradyrhizobium sp. Rc2d]
MIVAAVGSVGPSAIPAAGGDALDFLGGYLVSRAYFLGRPALDAFVQVLKLLTIIVIILAVADSISGKNVLPHETIALAEAVLRDGWARASSTFDHPILFGVFCAVTAAILLYWEKTFLGRSGAAGLCLLGCFLSLSSAALMASAIILIVFAYDQLFGRYSWRWSAFWVTLGASMLAVLVVTEHPLNWIFSHLTFNPQTGYYRAMVWDVALTYIAQSPVIGYGYEFNDVLLDNTVDSIWLVLSLRFGVPMLLLFFLTNVAAFFSNPRSLEGAGDVHMDRMRLAFTLVLLMFMFTGLTVHFWKSMLTFWGVCLGVRASLRESAIHGIG